MVEQAPDAGNPNDFPVVPDSFPLIFQAISMHFYRSRPSWFLVTPRVHND